MSHSNIKWFVLAAVVSILTILLVLIIAKPREMTPLPKVKVVTMAAVPRITKPEMEALAARGELQWARIAVSTPTDLGRIADTGVVIWTQEPNYVVIAGDSGRLNKVRDSGFSLQTPT